MRLHTATWLPRLAFGLLALGLGILALGYWGAWLPHPAAGLNILGIDLAEFVKFVPEVRAGQIPMRREVFYAPLVTLSLGLALLATIRRPRLALPLRLFLLALAIPPSLAMLPPAWTPALMRTAEFRQQTFAILLLLGAVLLAPLWRRYLPDWARGILFVALAYLPFPAIAAFQRLLPALTVLYSHDVAPGRAFYLLGLGAGLMAAGGLLLTAQAIQASRLAKTGRNAG